MIENAGLIRPPGAGVPARHAKIAANSDRRSNMIDKSLMTADYNKATGRCDRCREGALRSRINFHGEGQFFDHQSMDSYMLHPWKHPLNSSLS